MTNACSINLLESALAGSLPAAEEIVLQQHLDACESCSAVLERMAGWDEWRKEATALLAEDDLDELQPTGEDWAVDFTVEHLEPSDQPNAIGRLGEFDVLEIIGQGGMGVVLKGYDQKLNRYVAIKVLSPHLARNSLARKRFAREAQAAAAVVHPHVLAIHQVQPNGALPYLVMPLVSGDSVAQRLARQGTLELKETLRIGMQAAAGLAAAHEQGLVHRDVKPANILLEKGVERAVLTDFGLARAADDVTLTRWGVIAGTPQYMSPEQARGEALDGRSDLFSLGCVLYEMSTGVSPFRADSLVATMRRLVEEQPRAMESLNPELPPWFVAIVERLLEKDASRRYATAKEVSELLETCLAHVQQPANVPLPKELPRTKPAAAAAGWGSRWRRNRWSAVAAAVLLLGFGGGGAFLLATAEPTDISGEWTGEGWDRVTLKLTGTAEYEGTYTDTFGKQPGKIELKWSRIERRYNGTWSEDKERFGKISVREAGGEIRGAWTTSRDANVNPGTPELADLLWVRATPSVENEDKSSNLMFGPVVERTLNGVAADSKTMLDLESGQVASSPENEVEILVRSNDAHVVACEEKRAEGVWRGLRIVEGVALSNADWNATPEEVVAKFAAAKRELAEYQERSGVRRLNEMGVVNPSPGDCKQVYYIRTSKGTTGVLQITRFDWGNELPMKVSFRYKLLNKVRTSEESTTKAAVGAGETAVICEAGRKTATTGRGFVAEERKDGLPLADAVEAFNEMARQDTVGKDQPLLTEDEVACAVGWWASLEKDHLSAREYEFAKKVIDKRILPVGWRIDVLQTLEGQEGELFQGWMIRLYKPKSYPIIIRQRLLYQLDAGTRKPIPLPELKKPDANDDNTPLAAAIHGFNETHTGLCDVPQQPLTEEEVVAAIRWWKTKRNEAPVTNGEFAAFQKIADTRELPKGTEFELLPSFQNSDGSDFHIWSVRIRMPQESKPGWTYAYVLREQAVRLDGSETKNAQTAWGPPSADGLQVGLLLKPWRERYVSGETVTPVFVYRNVGDATVEASFPRIMTHSYYRKMNVNAQGASLEQDEKPGGPVGWMSVQLAPGLRHEVQGLPILLGDGKRGEAETAIRVAVGETVTLAFDVPHPVYSTQESLSTGELHFSIVAEPPKAGEFPARRTGQADPDAPASGSKESAKSDLKFGPVMERTVQDISTGKNCALKLETGELVSPPAELKSDDQLSTWARKNDIDFVVGIDMSDKVSANGTKRGLTTFDMFWIGPASFDNSTAQEAIDAIPYYENQMHFKEGDLRHLPLGVSEYKPETLYFRTRNGKIGVMEVAGFTENPVGLRIRYKIVERVDGQ